MKILVFLILLPLFASADNDSLLEKRQQLLNRYEVQQKAITASEAELMEQIIRIDEKLLWNYQNVNRRFQSAQQEKQVYLAQNIQLSKELEEVKKEQLMLYIVAGFIVLLFIGMFIIFFVQLKKINDLAIEAQDLYNINENMRKSLENYEKRYYQMKDEHDVINTDLSKLREIMAKTEMDYALIEEQLHNEKRKNQVLSQKLNNLTKN